MLESLKIIFDETMEIYDLATLRGILFIPFFLCLIYLLFSSVQEDDRIRRYLVYPSLVLMFFLFNPVFIHFLLKYIEVPERIVRIYWPLPMDLLFVYCLIRLFSGLRSVWKKAALLVLASLFLFVNAGGRIAGSESYRPAANALKLPQGTREIADQLYMLNDYQPVSVIMPDVLFFWTREYSYFIRTPYFRDMKDMYDEDDVLDLEMVSQAAEEGDCRFVVLDETAPTLGEPEDYGLVPVSAVPTQFGVFTIYQRN